MTTEKSMHTLSAHQVLDWLKEREANARRIADSKLSPLQAPDRAGWLEDATYFEAAAAAVWAHAEAIAAIEGLLNVLPSATTHPAIKRARAVISKATGDAE